MRMLIILGFLSLGVLSVYIIFGTRLIDGLFDKFRVKDVSNADELIVAKKVLEAKVSQRKKNLGDLASEVAREYEKLEGIKTRSKREQ